MPYTVDWMVEGRVVLDRLSGEVTMDDIAQTSERITDLMRQGKPPMVHLIVELTAVEKLPMGIHIGKINQYMMHTKEPNLGWSLVVTKSIFLRFLASVATQVARGRYRAFDTFEEAVAFLADVDATLPEFQAQVTTPK